MFSNMENRLSSFTDAEVKKIRPKSSYVPGKSYSSHEVLAFPAQVWQQIQKQFLPNYATKPHARSSSEYRDAQPLGPGSKFSIPVYKAEGQKSRIVKTNKRKIRPNGGSFGTGVENTTVKFIKFPSQKTLLSKEKLLPLKSSEKQQYEVEISRLLKVNCDTLYISTAKQHQAFKRTQVQKYKDFAADNCRTPRVAFNYDGSIMNVDTKKRECFEVIQCEGYQCEEADRKQEEQKITYKRKRAHKKYQSESEVDYYTNYQNVEKVSSKYIDNFFKVPWSDKVTVVNDNKTSYQVLNKNPQNHLLPEELALRINSPSINKGWEDQKAVVRVFNDQAYKEQLIKTSTKYCENVELNQQMKKTLAASSVGVAHQKQKGVHDRESCLLNAKRADKGKVISFSQQANIGEPLIPNSEIKQKKGILKSHPANNFTQKSIKGQTSGSKNVINAAMMQPQYSTNANTQKQNKIRSFSAKQPVYQPITQSLNPQNAQRRAAKEAAQKFDSNYLTSHSFKNLKKTRNQPAAKNSLAKK